MRALFPQEQSEAATNVRSVHRDNRRRNMSEVGKFGLEANGCYKSPSYSETTGSRFLRGAFSVITAMITVLCPAARAQQTHAQNQDGITIQGKVLNSGGKSIGEASVSLEQEGTRKHIETKTDAAGVFAFTALPPGRYFLSAEKSGQKTH